jgi:3-oxoadipate enol-lactonase
MESRDLVAWAPDGVPLAVTVSGADGPPLVMIPGLGAVRRVYSPIVPLLARQLRVAVFDPRGTGQSGTSPGPFTLTQLAADAVAVLDELGWERAAVFGASMGGMVAQWVALDHPGRVWRLLLACTGPGAAHAVPADRDATRALLGKGASTPADAYRLATSVLYERGWADAHREEVEAEIAYRGANPVRGQAFSAQYAAVRLHDSWERLPGITAPTLVLHGTADVVMPPENGRLLARRIPNARWLPLEGRGHLFWHEDPQTSADAIARFAAGEPVGEDLRPHHAGSGI